eukprot:6490351-Amphidinium_carterae.1
MQKMEQMWSTLPTCTAKITAVMQTPEAAVEGATAWARWAHRCRCARCEAHFASCWSCVSCMLPHLALCGSHKSTACNSACSPTLPSKSRKILGNVRGPTGL